MKPVYIGLIGFFVFASWTTFSRWHFMCKMMERCHETAVADELTPIPRTKDLSFLADTKPVLTGYEQFGFRQKNATPELTKDNEAFLTAVEQYLKANPTAKLRIIGNLMASEKGVAAGMFENLGIARAAAVRDMLQKRGVKNAFVLDAKVTDDLTKPLAFEAALTSTPDEYDTENQAFTFANMNFSEINFDYNSDVFNPNTAFNHYADSVLIHFNKNPNQSLTIIGHTDIKGGEAYNQQLGLKRANSVKKYLVETKKIPAERMKTASKGESEPAFKPEDKPENMAKNRRVNIKIE